jgi:hypothetical protein
LSLPGFRDRLAALPASMFELDAVSQLLRAIGMTNVKGPTVEAGISNDQLSGPAAGPFGLDRRLV